MLAIKTHRTPAKDKTMAATILNGVVQVQAKATSTKDKEEHQLVISQNKILLDWHIVCGSYEHEELARYGVIKPWHYNDPRHQLFDHIDMPNQTKWQGDWGNEPLCYDRQLDLLRGQMGRVWSTSARAEEISTWIRDQMFNVAPGNE